MLKKFEKQICMIIAVTMFFTGMCLEMADSSFDVANRDAVADSAIVAENYVLDVSVPCTMDMIRSRISGICKIFENSVTSRQQNVTVVFCIVGMFLQYLFYYQSCESKEDAQLFLCRFVAVRYIHQKDGEK